LEESDWGGVGLYVQGALSPIVFSFSPGFSLGFGGGLN